MLVQGDRGGGGEPRAPGRVSVRTLHGDATGRAPAAPMGASGSGQGLYRVEETRGARVPLELPVTRQLRAILARRRQDGDAGSEALRG